MRYILPYLIALVSIRSSWISKKVHSTSQSAFKILPCFPVVRACGVKRSSREPSLVVKVFFSRICTHVRSSPAAHISDSFLIESETLTLVSRTFPWEKLFVISVSLLKWTLWSDKLCRLGKRLIMFQIAALYTSVADQYH